ncbi:MAG: hypothetical protein WC792_02145 [Candidatus Micrarchaeia archaeon]|jgi:hypothetical protein
MENTIVCDSSPLISFSDTCNIDALRFLKSRGARFVAPPGVRAEIVSNPMHIRKYQFSAVRLKKILDDKVLEIASVPGLAEKTSRVLETANAIFEAKGKPLKVVHLGEAECIALFEAVGAKALLIDEKTTRLLIENPYKLAELMQGEYGSKIGVNEGRLSEFRKMTRNLFVLRSAEALAVAAKRGFFRDYGDSQQEAFHSALYALREAGCSITTGELDEYEKMSV